MPAHWLASKECKHSKSNSNLGRKYLEQKCHLPYEGPNLYTKIKNSEIHYNMLANPHKYKAEKKNKKTVVRVTRATLFYPADPNLFFLKLAPNFFFLKAKDRSSASSKQVRTTDLEKKGCGPSNNTQFEFLPLQERHARTHAYTR